MNAYLALLWRPSTPIWMLWLTSIVLAFGESPFGRALNLSVLPLFAGLLLSQPARDLQSLSLSWTLPKLRRRLLPPLIAIQGLLALGCAVWVDHGLAFWPAFGLAMAFCSMGSAMNTDQSSLIELRLNLSLATWALAFVALLRFDLLMSAAAAQPIITTVVSLLVAAFIFRRFDCAPHTPKAYPFELLFAGQLTQSGRIEGPSQAGPFAEVANSYGQLRRCNRETDGGLLPTGRVSR